MSPAPASGASTALRETLASQGFSFVDGNTMRGLLDAAGALDDWTAFAESWGNLSLDEYMADGGRYRRRRHAVFRASESGRVRQAHQPHFQALEYNPVHGGVARLFEPSSVAYEKAVACAQGGRYCDNERNRQPERVRAGDH